jgi:transposase InsO family protein
LDLLGLPPATYYRWTERQAGGTLTDQIVLPLRQVLLPTPVEVAAVCQFARRYPEVGYKRLTWQMVDQDVACLRPYQVYAILTDNNLMARSAKPVETGLHRPPEPDHADEVWHIDLMYLYIRSKWYYLVDILDGYSRYLVAWSLNLTMAADTVTSTVEQALEKLINRRPGEPRLVHDHGSQFVSREWHDFITSAGVTDIKTRVAHPQSNGRLERLHRTHREEGLTDDDQSSYYAACDGLTRWSAYYNTARPHSSLNYLYPVDYYRGDPVARLAERQEKLAEALKERQGYWQTNSDVKGQDDPLT